MKSPAPLWMSHIPFCRKECPAYKHDPTIPCVPRCDLTDIFNPDICGPAVQKAIRAGLALEALVSGTNMTENTLHAALDTWLEAITEQLVSLKTP